MRTISLIIVILSLSGCFETPYKRLGTVGFFQGGGGYSETQLDTNVFEVIFVGNSETPRSRANNFVLLRSAELAIKNGYKYFVVMDNQQYSAISLNRNLQGLGTDVVQSPRNSKIIMCFKEKPKGFSYNARFVEKSLKKKYKLK